MSQLFHFIFYNLLLLRYSPMSVLILPLNLIKSVINPNFFIIWCILEFINFSKKSVDIYTLPVSVPSRFVHTNYFSLFLSDNRMVSIKQWYHVFHNLTYHTSVHIYTLVFHTPKYLKIHLIPLEFPFIFSNSFSMLRTKTIVWFWGKSHYCKHVNK